MVQIQWWAGPLTVRRIVLGDTLPPTYAGGYLAEARRHGLDVGGAETAPRRGDLWVACAPEAGWGDTDPRAAGWVRSGELSLVLTQLRQLPTAGGVDLPLLLRN